MGTRYLDEFVSLHCAPDLLAAKLFPNSKEITESMGAWNAVRTHVMPWAGIRQGDPGVEVFVVGDGHVPRTAALFAHMSRWTCWSIDPVMRPRTYHIERLHTVCGKVEDFRHRCGNDIKLCLIVHVHSHARPSASLRNISGGGLRCLIDIPCCVTADISPASLSYADKNINSGKNTVNVYFNVPCMATGRPNVPSPPT